jgi:hypothetical protein
LPFLSSASAIPSSSASSIEARSLVALDIAGMASSAWILFRQYAGWLRVSQIAVQQLLLNLKHHHPDVQELLPLLVMRHRLSTFRSFSYFACCMVYAPRR